MKFLQKWDKMWMAITFAEANESELARKIYKPRKEQKLQKRARVYA